MTVELLVVRFPAYAAGLSVAYALYELVKAVL